MSRMLVPWNPRSAIKRSAAIRIRSRARLPFGVWLRSKTVRLYHKNRTIVPNRARARVTSTCTDLLIVVGRQRHEHGGPRSLHVRFLRRRRRRRRRFLLRRADADRNAVDLSGGRAGDRILLR